MLELPCLGALQRGELETKTKKTVKKGTQSVARTDIDSRVGADSTLYGHWCAVHQCSATITAVTAVVQAVDERRPPTVAYGP